MSVRIRHVLTAFSIVLWAAWLILAWLTTSDPDAAPLESFGEQVARLTAVTCTIGVLVCWAVCPLVETARIWMKIGQREAQCSCASQPQRVVGGANVIPIRPVKTNVLSDN